MRRAMVLGAALVVISAIASARSAKAQVTVGAGPGPEQPIHVLRTHAEQPARGAA